MTKLLERPSDPNELAKLIADIATGKVKGAWRRSGR